MAYGRHWEWRGFGTLPAHARSRIESLETAFYSPDVVTDEYLWVPGAAVNIKLRTRGSKSLKLKRLLQSDDDCAVQLWEERATDEFFLPMASARLAPLCEALGIELYAEKGVVDRDALLRLVRQSSPDVHVVAVRKTRRLHLWQERGQPVTIDLAEISEPENIVSVGLEDAWGISEASAAEHVNQAKDAVLATVQSLGLQKTMRPMTYLEAIGIWVSGGLVGTA